MFLSMKYAGWFMCSINRWVRTILCNISRTTSGCHFWYTRVSFLVHQVPRTSATVLRYRQVFMQFSLHVWASKYTCRPIIANLLYILRECRLNPSKIYMHYWQMTSRPQPSVNNYKLCIRSVVKCDSQGKLNKTANKHCYSVLIIGDSEFSLV